MAESNNNNTFVMHGARSAIAGGLSHIEEQVKALELAISENAGQVFDLAKALIESTCKTIIKDRGGNYEKTDGLPSLFKTATQILPFLPPDLSGETEARKSLAQTLNGLSTAVQGVCELRNNYGFSSHGSDTEIPIMGEIHALLASQTADAIIGFLYRAHRQAILSPALSQAYEDYPDYNEWIDEQLGPLKIFSLGPYLASEILFKVDRGGYFELMQDFDGIDDQGELDD